MRTTLDELVAAHRAVRGSARGRRFATLQINHAYAVLLSSQFQAFCRDLHSEAVDVLVTSTSPSTNHSILRSALVQGRKLDRGNPNPGNVGADFGRLGFSFWPAVTARSHLNAKRQANLAALNDWRNAIAHQDWTSVGTSTLHRRTIERWRSACNMLARAFDSVLRMHLSTLVGRFPW